MNHLPRTTVAGRHAADRERADALLQRRVDQDAARASLDSALRVYGLRTIPHFHPGIGEDQSLWVDCRVASARADHQLIYAVLDEQGWTPDRARLSRHRVSHDVIRLRHGRTNAALVLIIKIPCGDVPELEAA